MKIGQSLNLLTNPVTQRPGDIINTTLKETNESFSKTLQQAVTDVGSLQNEAGKAIDKMVSGEATNMHDVMIAVEKAKTSFDLLMELRNKTIDAYRELMRIQV